MPPSAEEALDLGALVAALERTVATVCATAAAAPAPGRDLPRRIEAPGEGSSAESGVSGECPTTQVPSTSRVNADYALKQRPAFAADVDRVFYAKNEASARRAFGRLKARWERAYPTAVGILERDLDSLLRFYRWEKKYWPRLRTTNPIERVHKEFKRRTRAMEITGSEQTTYRLLAYVALTMNTGWRTYTLSTPRYFYTLKAA